MPAVEPADGIATADVSILIPILSDWRDFSYPHTAFPSHFFCPPPVLPFHTLLVSCFADEERKPLDELLVQARAVCLGAIVRWDTFSLTSVRTPPLLPSDNGTFLLNRVESFAFSVRMIA